MIFGFKQPQWLSRVDPPEEERKSDPPIEDEQETEIVPDLVIGPMKCFIERDQMTVEVGSTDL